ncbi:GLOBIN domain-containing protein [Trichonephila inaurata madagascariensis]|uniref:GLOBIN domain-containing protein n=1 Tax=Trichonephila inaurata madagascariensis TaxID=2747483 RepID=A0A8X7C156_9ARAC|nr:GLOBIN domain-containing protein [Trichonephila inaurata madagascariensis]
MPFKGLSKEELRHSTELRAHGLRVMGFVQKVVARFDEPEKSEQLLKELGRNHVMYGAKIDYVDLKDLFQDLLQYMTLQKKENESKEKESSRSPFPCVISSDWFEKGQMINAFIGSEINERKRMCVME